MHFVRHCLQYPSMFMLIFLCLRLFVPFNFASSVARKFAWANQGGTQKKDIYIFDQLISIWIIIVKAINQGFSRHLFSPPKFLSVCGKLAPSHSPANSSAVSRHRMSWSMIKQRYYFLLYRWANSMILYKNQWERHCKWVQKVQMMVRTILIYCIQYIHSV